jgi:hypothetical protein
MEGKGATPMHYTISPSQGVSDISAAYLFKDNGSWFLTLFPCDWKGGVESVLHTWFDSSCHVEAKAMLSALQDELKERGLLPM